MTVQTMTDDLCQAERHFDVIQNKLARIERNRDKIANMLMDDHFDATGRIGINESPADFADALYISSLRAEIYSYGDVELIFSVKSRRHYSLSVDYECELHADNSFEF